MKTNKIFQTLCLTIVASTAALFIVPQGVPVAIVGSILLLSFGLLLTYYHRGRTSSPGQLVASLVILLLVPYIFLYGISRGVIRFWFRGSM